MPLTSKFKTVTIKNQLLNKLSDYINSAGTSKVTLLKEWENVVEKIPRVVNFNRTVRNDQPFQTNSVDNQVKNNGNVDLNLLGNDEATEPPRKVQELKAGGRYTLDIPKLFDGIKRKLSSNRSKDTIPKWKTRRPTISLESINSRTKHVLASVLSAETETSRLKRLEEFTSHIMKYPRAKPFAVKEGAVRLLLNLRQETNDEDTHQIIREAFAILGHIDPPVSSGVRILSIDGGGIRGIAVIRMLQKLESMSGKKIYELFDFICGVSTGAIITCCTVPPQGMDMESLYKLYRELSAKVFQQSALWGTSKLVWSHAYYDTSLWERLLTDCIGNTRLLDSARYKNSPKVCTISSIVNHSKVIPFLFRNYSVPYLRKSEYQGSSRHTMFEAIRASAAAPTIFEEYRIGELLHQDGGIIVNNPAAVAVHEVKALWPDEPISCVVSCGTGRYNPVPTLEDVANVPQTSTSWKQIFDKILDSATDTEAVHNMLKDLLPEDVYYRLNPHLTESVTMDEIRDDKILALESETDMYCRRNEEKFHDLIKKLTTPRTSAQKCQDFLKLKAKLFGYVS